MSQNIMNIVVGPETSKWQWKKFKSVKSGELDHEKEWDPQESLDK